MSGFLSYGLSFWFPWWLACSFFLCRKRVECIPVLCWNLARRCLAPPNPLNVTSDVWIFLGFSCLAFCAWWSVCAYSPPPPPLDYHMLYCRLCNLTAPNQTSLSRLLLEMFEAIGYADLLGNMRWVGFRDAFVACLFVFLCLLTWHTLTSSSSRSFLVFGCFFGTGSAWGKLGLFFFHECTRYFLVTAIDFVCFCLTCVRAHSIMRMYRYRAYRMRGNVCTCVYVCQTPS